MGVATRLAIMGAVAAGALGAAAWRRGPRRMGARRDPPRLRTVATFALVEGEDAGDEPWEVLRGRALFKRLCARLAEEGFPPSDLGDVERTHDCVVHVDGKPLYLSMRNYEGDGRRWTLALGRRPGRPGLPTSPPVDTPLVRRFLRALETVLAEAAGETGARWHRRQRFARGRLVSAATSPFADREPTPGPR